MSKKVKIALLVFLFVGTAIVSYLMRSALAREELWGHLPLMLYIFGYGFFVILLEKRFSKHPRRLHRLGLATLAGFLLSIGFPVSPLTPIMFIGFVPLLMVENEISNQRTDPSKWEVFKYAYHAFVVWNMLTTFWVNNTAFIAGFIAIFFNSFFMAIPFVLFHQSKKVLGLKFAMAAFAAYWISFEYLHMRQELAWPWLTLGNSFAQYPSWVQWYEYSGVFGGSLWILLGNYLFYKIANKYFSERKGIDNTLLLKGLTLVLIPILISVIWYFSYNEKGDPVEVVVVQPNYEPHYEKFNASANEIMEKALGLARQKVTDSTEYLVFPETLIGGLSLNRLNSQVRIRDFSQFANQFPNLKIVSGISATKILSKEERAQSNAVRTSYRRGDTIFWEAYNAAIQIESSNRFIPVYKKSYLVPGAEFTPYRKIFWWAEPIVDKLGGSLAGLGAQPERSTFNGNGHSIGPVVCYESVYGEYCNGYVQNGAEALFIVTNDGWWDNTAGHKQHLKFASLRAIENRRPIARSANTGISSFINQRGDISNKTKYGTDAVIKAKIMFNDQRTFYSKWGDLIGRIALFVAALLIFNTIARRWMAKVQKKKE